MLRDEWRRVLVCLRSDLSSAIEHVPLPAGYGVRAMDMFDEHDIAAWLRIHNDAYEREWGDEQYRWALLDNPDVKVAETLFVVRGDEPVGAASLGWYRSNPRVALDHYLAVVPRAQGLGLGRHLVALRSHRALESGAIAHEAQTHIWRERSLAAHFACGFRPKPRLDHWNKRGSTFPGIRALATVRLVLLYRAWRRAAARRAAEGSTAGASSGRRAER